MESKCITTPIQKSMVLKNNFRMGIKEQMSMTKYIFVTGGVVSGLGKRDYGGIFGTPAKSAWS